MEEADPQDDFDLIDLDLLDIDTLSPVGQAVLAKDIQLLQELLKKGSSVNKTDNRGWTPLHVAASLGCVEAVQHLLMADNIRVESGPHCDFSALYVACCGRTVGHREVVELLLSKHPNLGSGNRWFVPLHTATKLNKVDIVKLLLGAGVDPDVVDYDNTTALHVAAEGSLEIAQLLLKKGGNLNIKTHAHEETAFHNLFYYYNEDNASTFNSMLDLFLSSGSDINAQTRDGTTPLMLAVQVGWEWAVDWLLDHGADVCLWKVNYKMALHFAIEATYDLPDISPIEEEELVPPVLKKILHHTPVDRIPKEGTSIFHLAIESKRFKVLRNLIEEGLHPDDFLVKTAKFISDDGYIYGTPVMVPTDTSLYTPLAYLLFQDLTMEVVDTAKYMIDKGSSINAPKPGVLSPLVAAVTARHPDTFKDGGLGQEILQYLLAQGSVIMHKTSESDLLPVALAAASLFNVVGFFRLLQHGVPAHRLYTHSSLTPLKEYYQAVSDSQDQQEFSWLVLSWLRTANLFVPQLPVDASNIFTMDLDMSDESLAQAWQQAGTLISSPKRLWHLCVLKIRCVLGERRGWEQLQHSLKQLHAVLPPPIIDLLHFRWVETDTLQLDPPPGTGHPYVTDSSPFSSDHELTGSSNGNDDELNGSSDSSDDELTGSSYSDVVGLLVRLSSSDEELFGSSSSSDDDLWQRRRVTRRKRKIII